jgi:hypothetical protein
MEILQKTTANFHPASKSRNGVKSEESSMLPDSNNAKLM